MSAPKLLLEFTDKEPSEIKDVTKKQAAAINARHNYNMGFYQPLYYSNDCVIFCSPEAKAKFDYYTGLEYETPDIYSKGNIFYAVYWEGRREDSSVTELLKIIVANE